MAERDDVPPHLQIGDAPVDPKYANLMGTLAHAIDKLLNEADQPKQNGFILMVFPFGEVGDQGRANYISNARREDVAVMLRSQLRRFEGMPSGEGHG